MAVRIQLRRDTAANWSSTNPVLNNGEPGFDTTNKILKIGDGVTAWNSLPNKFATDAQGALADTALQSQTFNESIIIYLGGLDTDIAATTKAAIIPYLPYNLEVSELVLEVDTAPTGNDPGIEVDINVDGTSFLTTVISIDENETSSTTAAVSYAINTTAFPNSRIPKGSTVTVDIDLAGATVAGQNLVLVINGVRY